MLDEEAKIFLVTDWLVSYAGAERVISQIIKSISVDKLFSVVDFIEPNQREYFNNLYAITSFVQKLPGARKNYQKYLPLMPLAIEQLDVSNADIVISSSHAVAKGVLTGPEQLHISYVHSPMRYAWDLQHQYLKEAGLNKGIKGIIAKWLLHKLRVWDYRTSNGVDYFIANSQFIARRIKKVYGRNSTVIYPPVAVSKFRCVSKKENFYLTASRLVPYKRVGLIVKAFMKMPDKKLVVIGKGSEFRKIELLAKACQNIQLLGFQDDETLQSYMERAKAFVFAAEEDFGIIPVEAQASGTPVIAFGRGGTLETVRPLGVEQPTGIFFQEQTASAICHAVEIFEANIDKFAAKSCRANAELFSEDRFKKEFVAFLNNKYHEFKEGKKIKYS